jgi:hypothetical protein
MVDLLGKPSCAECFESCLKRDSRSNSNSPDRKSIDSPREKKSANIGGTTGSKSRDSSPAIEELEARLGINKTKDDTSASTKENDASASMTTTPLRKRYSAMGHEASPISFAYSKDTGASPGKAQGDSSSPTRPEISKAPGSELRSRLPVTPTRIGRITPRSSIGTSLRNDGSPKPTEEAVEEMKNRFLRGRSSPPTTPLRGPLPSTPSSAAASPSVRSTQLRDGGTPGSASKIPLSVLRSRTTSTPIPQVGLLPFEKDREHEAPSTPDLVSDVSDTVSVSSRSDVDSPLQVNAETDVFGGDDVRTRGQLEKKETTSQKRPSLTPLETSMVPISIADNAPCARCSRPLLSRKGGGRWVTVPGIDGGEAEKYHVDCFRCTVCEGVFKEAGRDGERGQAAFIRGREGVCHVDVSTLDQSSSLLETDGRPVCEA